MKGVSCVNSEPGVRSTLAKMSQQFKEANALSKHCKIKVTESVIFVRRMRAKPASRLCAFIFVLCFLQKHTIVHSFPEQGLWTLKMNESQNWNGVAKNLYKGTKIYIRVNCHYPQMKDNFNPMQDQEISIGWILRETQCWNDFAYLDLQTNMLPTYYNNPNVTLQDFPVNSSANYLR